MYSKQNNNQLESSKYGTNHMKQNGQKIKNKKGYSKAILKKWVLRYFLKVGNLVQERNSKGRLFHTAGAEQ